MTADASRRLLSMDLDDEDELEDLDEWGNRAALTAPAPALTSIPESFGEQVSRFPDAVAVRAGAGSMTYRELDEAANRLARLLIGRGVVPGQRVALLFPRSAEAIVAILGVLKTGAAYVPIDPAVPDARLKFVLDDAAPVAAVTNVELAGRLAGRQLMVIDVGDLDESAPDEQGSIALPAVQPDDVAYLIYTSGTTGTPKGVAIPHGNVIRLLDAIQPRLPLSPEMVFSQCHSLAFDFSVWEIWGALLRGGRVVVVPESVAGSPKDFAALMLAERVSVLSQTPSAFYA
ncbi:AMP-binding protein, partial [Mycolicibacterium sp. XJ662]